MLLGPPTAPLAGGAVPASLSWSDRWAREQVLAHGLTSGRAQMLVATRESTSRRTLATTICTAEDLDVPIIATTPTLSVCRLRAVARPASSGAASPSVGPHPHPRSARRPHHSHRASHRPRPRPECGRRGPSSDALVECLVGFDGFIAELRRLGGHPSRQSRACALVAPSVSSRADLATREVP